MRIYINNIWIYIVNMSIVQLAFCVLIGVVSLLLYKLKRRMSYWESRGICHDKPSFPMGNMKGFMHTRHYDHIFKEAYEKDKGSGSLAGFYFYMNTSVLALELQLIRQVLIKDFSKFAARGAYYNEKWKTLRHMLSSTFTLSKMHIMLPNIMKVAVDFNRVFGETAALSDGKVEIKELLARYTTDVIGAFAFGIECNSLKYPQHEFRVMGQNLNNF